MKLLALLLISFVSLATGAAQEPVTTVTALEYGNWVKVTPANAGFTVLMPAKPVEQSQPVAALPGVQNHLLSLETDLAGYVVSYVQFPGDQTDPASIKALLDRGREGGLKSSKGDLKSEKEIKINGYFGREWIMTLPGNLSARARAYWVTNTLYQIVFVEKLGATETPEGKRLRQEAQTRFLDSFTLSGNAGK